MDQIFHTSGTADINGIQVTVTSEGEKDTSTFCLDAQPYWIGGSTNGSYTFQFSPAIEALELNITSIHNDSGGSFEEIVKVKVNGSHYSIPALGEANECSPFLPILTSEGTLAAQANSERAGSNSISITGIISEVTVIDSAVVGNAGGALFSLYICSETAVSTAEIENADVLIYPNPTSEQLTIKGLPNIIDEIIFLDCLGRIQYPNRIIPGDETSIDVSNFSNGIYYVVIHTNNQTISRKVIVGK